MKTENTISKELLSHLVMLEEKHQEKVLAYIKKILGKEISTTDEEKEMQFRAEASERDIASGRVIEASQFKEDFEQWKKKKRASIKP
jgi:uncharacterized membrane protein